MALAKIANWAEMSTINTLMVQARVMAFGMDYPAEVVVDNGLTGIWKRASHMARRVARQCPERLDPVALLDDAKLGRWMARNLPHQTPLLSGCHAGEADARRC